MSSGTNLAVGAVVARTLPIEDFGAFSIAFVVYTFAIRAGPMGRSPPELVPFTRVATSRDVRMRIVVAHSFYRIAGGEDRYVRQQVELLARSHVVHLEERVNAELHEGFRTAVGMFHAPRERQAIGRVLREFRPDVVHLHNPYPSMGPAVHLTADSAGVALVQTVHNSRLRCPNGLMFTEGAPCTRCVGGRYDQAVRHGCFPVRSQAAAYASALWLNRFARRLDGRVDLYVAPSRFVRRRLVEWGIPAERTTVVRNFTVPPGVRSAPGKRGLYLGRLSPEKGVATLLEALRLAGDPPFDIVGGGPQAGSLRAQAALLGLRNTRLVGPVAPDDVTRVIEAARYAVVPSTCDEVFGLAALEAMAAGRPVVASDVGALPELVGTGRGRLVPPGDAAALADALQRYAEDPSVAAAEGARAREFAADEYSPEVHLAGLEAAYEIAIELRRRRTLPGE